MYESPPMYTRLSLPASCECTPAPVYTENAQVSEHVLHSEPVSPITSRVSEQAYVYYSDHLEISMGTSLWGLQYPTYGKGGVVEGTVKFTKKCSHVSQVTVTLSGSITTKASEHPLVALPQVTKLCIVEQVVTLHDTRDKAEMIPACKAFHFRIPFPDTVSGQSSTPLPPTFTVFHSAVTADVEYSLKVDVVRKGFHRHEMLAVPVLYFPKSRPTMPSVPARSFETPFVDNEERIKKVEIEPIWPKNKDSSSVAFDEVPSVNLLLPTPTCFASGDIIPVALLINCPSSPAVPSVLAPIVGVFLIKRKTLRLNGGRDMSVREQLIDNAQTFRLVDVSEGMRYLKYMLTAGEHGCEHSFKVAGAIKVEHFLRIIIRPPAYLKHLPVFQHDEPIMLTTDRHGTLERELLLTDGVPMPALGLAAQPLRCSRRTVH